MIILYMLIICALGSTAQQQHATSKTATLAAPPLRQQGCVQLDQREVLSFTAQRQCRQLAGRQRLKKVSNKSKQRSVGSEAQIAVQGFVSNPLLEYDLDQVLPDWQALKHADQYIVPAVEQLVGDFGEEEATLNALERQLNSTPVSATTFDAVFKPITQMRLRLDSVYNVYEHLQYVADTDALRNASDISSGIRFAFEQQLKQSSIIYGRVAFLNRTAIPRKMQEEEARLAVLTVRGLQASGVGINNITLRRRFTSIERRLLDRQDDYVNNLFDWLDGYSYTVFARSQMDGLPTSVYEAAAANARALGRQYRNANATHGPWMFMFDGNTAEYVLSFATDSNLRQEIYTAAHTAASDAPFDNTQAVVDILTFRRSKALLLGYRNFAAFTFASLMAYFAEANRTMHELALAAKAKAEREDTAVLQYAQETLGNPKLQLELWDWQYWRQQYKKATFRVDERIVREHLAVPNVLNGVFQWASTLFDIKINNVTDNPNFSTWHEDVHIYSISDGPTNTLLGYFYVDMYVREGKAAGGWAQPITDAAKFWREASPAAGVVSVGTSIPVSLMNQTYEWLEGAPKQLPVVALVLNQAPPTKDEPVPLMWLEDVGYLLHELGHTLHAILSTTEYGLAAGWRNIEADAGEVVSMMTEKWAFERDTFLSFARHWETNEPLNETLFDNIINMRQFGLGNYMAQQLVYTIADLRLHSVWNPAGKTPETIYAEVYNTYMPEQQVGTSYGVPNQLNRFDHVFGGYDYESVYYGYIWSDILSSSIYMKFQKDKAEDPASLARNGRSFRDTFLALGGSKSPDRIYEMFMGTTFTDISDLINYYGLEQAGGQP